MEGKLTPVFNTKISAGVHCLLLHSRAAGPAPSPIDDAPPKDADLVLFAGDVDGNLFAWDINPETFGMGELQEVKGAHGEAVNGLCVGADGILYSCSDDRQIRLWNTTKIETARDEPLRGHAAGVNAVHYHNTMLFSCDDNGKVRVWDTTAGHSVLCQFVAAQDACNSLVATAAGLWVAADDGLTLWPVTDRSAASAGEPFKCTRALQGMGCDGVAADRHGNVYVALNIPHAAGTIIVLNDKAMEASGEEGSAEEPVERPAMTHRALSGPDDHVRAPGVAGRWLCCGSDEGALHAWDLQGELQRPASDGEEEGQAGEEGAKRSSRSDHSFTQVSCGGEAEDEPLMGVTVAFGLVVGGDDDGNVAGYRLP